MGNAQKRCYEIKSKLKKKTNNLAPISSTIDVSDSQNTITASNSHKINIRIKKTRNLSLDKKKFLSNMTLHKHNNISNMSTNRTNRLMNSFNIFNSPRRFQSPENLSNINNGFLPLISIRQIFLDYFNKNKKYDDTSKIIIDYLNKKYIKKDFLTDQEIIKIDINLYNKIKKIRLNSDYYYNKYIFLYNIIEKNFKQRSYYKCEFCNKYMLDKLHHFKNCKELENCFENKESIIKYIIDNYYINKLYKTNYTIEYYINYYKNKDLKDFFKNINMHIIKNYKFEEYNYIKEFKKNNKYNIFKILSEIEKNKEIEEKNKEIKLDEEEESEEDEEIEQKEINDEILEEKSCDEIIYKIKEMNQPKKINLALEMNPFKNFSNYYKNLINEKRKREERKKYEKNIEIIYNYKKNEPDILKKREILDKKFISLINNK